MFSLLLMEVYSVDVFHLDIVSELGCNAASLAQWNRYWLIIVRWLNLYIRLVEIPTVTVDALH